MNSIETQSPNTILEANLESNLTSESGSDQAALAALQKLVAQGARSTAGLLEPLPTENSPTKLPENSTPQPSLPAQLVQSPAPEVTVPGQPQAKLPETPAPAPAVAPQTSLFPKPAPAALTKMETPQSQTAPVGEPTDLELAPPATLTPTTANVAAELTEEPDTKHITPENIGDEILQAFASQSSTAPTQITSANAVQANSAPTVDMAARIETFVNQITDRILVTDPLHGQNSQVHIKIADHVLPGTEVQIWRGDNNQLNVHFATAYAQSAGLLADASAALAQRLNERLSLSQPVVVTVQTDERGGMPQDGRSRQYQSVYDLLAQTQGN